MRTSTPFSLALGLAIVALGALAWLLAWLGGPHHGVGGQSPALAVGLVVLLVVVASASALAAAWLFRRIPHGDREPERGGAQDSIEVLNAAEVQAEQAEAVIRQVKEEAARARLSHELAEVRADRSRNKFHVVVFGTGSAGKTSLINALLGREVGKTEAVMGTTRQAERHTHVVEGVEGTLLLTDTPGLSEIGREGDLREAEARDLAARADLLLFIVDHDLIRSQAEPLMALAKQGKRSIVVLNKVDRFLPEDAAAILAKLRERLEGIISAVDVIGISASPRPTPVRVRSADGQSQTVFEVEPPDVKALVARIAAILAREGQSLRAGNLLLRAHLVEQAAQEQLTRERRARAQSVIDRYQWITAATVFTNPVPALDLMATGAVQFQMISEMAAAYGIELTVSHVRMIGVQMVQMLLKLGIAETAASLIAGLFKSSFLGYAAGGAVQATTMAYLTHVSGHAFLEYFDQGQSWGEEGIRAALLRQFDLNGRADFLQEFVRQALDRVVKKVAPKPHAPVGPGP